MKKILLTGGAGYLGSHITLALMKHGHDVIVLDNFSNSSIEAMDQVYQIAKNKDYNGKLTILNRDLCVLDDIIKTFSENEIESVIHLAGLKSVTESIQDPIRYYNVNVIGAINLISVMEANDIKEIVFSSSATVYGLNAPYPYIETMERGLPSSPYGSSKAIIEKILEEKCFSSKEWRVSILRYFNPVGAHESGLIGEDPLETPNNLMPYLSQVAVGRLEKLYVYGGNYDTPDGTCRRDYIHVIDLAEGHLSALNKIKEGCSIFNLGTGKPISVLEMIDAFSQVIGKKIPFEIVKPRAGDLPEFWADCKKANTELGWLASRGVEEMCTDAWRWQSLNPNGYIKKS